MSLVKDVERVGDLAKDIADLAYARSGWHGDDLADVASRRQVVVDLLNQVTDVLRDHDTRGADTALDHALDLRRGLDGDISRLVASRDQAPGVVVSALYFLLHLTGRGPSDEPAHLADGLYRRPRLPPTVHVMIERAGDGAAMVDRESPYVHASDPFPSPLVHPRFTFRAHTACDRRDGVSVHQTAAAMRHR